MKSFWEKFVSEKVSDEYRKKVLSAARIELAKNYAPPFQLRLAFSFGVAVVAAVGVWYYQQQAELKHRDNNENIATFEVDGDEVDDLDIVNELDWLEDMEVIEQWAAI